MAALRGREEVLLFGMVFSNEFVPNLGQEFRDRVRCEALESLGYSVRTLDNKHDDSKLEHGKHCRTNFCQPRRMFQAMKSKWGNRIRLDHIILDYFFSPVGWARTRWTDCFFTDTLPELAKEKLISVGGKIWLPNLECIKASVDKFRSSIDEFYTVISVTDPMQNPLYVATENAYEELMRCPQPPTNISQMNLADPTFPFIVLVLKENNNSGEQTASEDNKVQKRQKLDDEEDDHASKALLMWDAISATPKLVDGTKLVRVFTGGLDSVQSGPFLHAMSSVQRRLSSRMRIVVETLSTQELCRRKWQPDQMMNWFLPSHVHFFLAHIHQSLLLHNLVWEMEYACQQYNRLKYHLGFPSGDQLRCPVFTQDKIKYVECLQTLAVKTMTVPLTADGIFDHNCLADVERFVIHLIYSS